ncbi:MAG: MmcQ/YjbR family DNA-binding protein [Ilumatobacteraceae bacterium]
MATEADARRIALSLPETTEKPSYGTPGFRVKDKLFARMHDLPDTLVVWVADMAEKEAMLAADPDAFFETPHYDGYPMLLVRLPAIDADELGEVLTDSWRARAPRRLLAEFDRDHPT